MTVSILKTKVLYTGNGQTTQWDIPFPFLSKDDVHVYLVDSYGESLLLSSDYSIDDATRVLTYPLAGTGTPALSSQQKLLILRSTPLQQQTSFGAQDDLDPSVLEAGYDKAMLIAQELAEQMERSIKLPASSQSDETDLASYLQQLQDEVAQAQAAASNASTSAQAASASTQLAQMAASTAQTAAQSSTSAASTAQTAAAAAAAAVKTELQADINAIATDVNLKADKDLSNAVPGSTFKTASVGWVQPDYGAGVAWSWGENHTAPSAGVVCFGREAYQTATQSVYWQVNAGNKHYFGGNNGGVCALELLLSAGDVFYAVGGKQNSEAYVYFYPAKGVN